VDILSRLVFSAAQRRLGEAFAGRRVDTRAANLLNAVAFPAERDIEITTLDVTSRIRLACAAKGPLLACATRFRVGEGNRNALTFSSAFKRAPTG